MKQHLLVLMLVAWSGSKALCADSQELQIVLQEAKGHTKNGEYAEALDKLAWYHENSRGTAHAGVRLSFAMNDWKALGEQFPPAKDKLMAIRDEQEKKLLTGKGGFFDGKNGFMEFTEVAAIDRTYGQEKKSYELICKLAEQSPDRAKACFFAVRDLLVKNHDYALYLKLSPEPERQFLSWEYAWKSDALRPQNDPVAPVLRGLHLKTVRQLIEVLVGAGQPEKAADIHKRALELTKEKSLESALEDAKQRVKSKP